ncbi:bifunctional chorismate mutase/prephenate dehydrogenase [Leptothermofonsia sichuanensis E412]|uniref:bifunctional chorismate mutase/prephenate dehydrogenase n=1 Tax=Leptothermofonsia sichuanensis TaxID=2917832 RepID=UPI001CA77089|nr:bifunctional chorismate mutase/prephenate dehydrogenase [Leptothermofonsia sichuanensis]QZZ19700.1 bifunctional chorismate mutase/prephenate dehydrogenase [Leptothermofonsia sichuanensis E412]
MVLPEHLQQIDRDLIHLLSKRISVLAASKVPSIQEQLSGYRALLMQAGIPESTWSGIVAGCMAALASVPSCHQKQPSRRITVVGGRGAMGCFFTERLSAAGHEVSVLEHDDWDRADVLLGTADLVLICVPLKATVAVIRRVAPYLSHNTILADIASTKRESVEAMMECHSGPVVGLHPMFGPGVGSFLGQKVMVCPGREPDAFGWLLDLIEGDGGKLVPCTPDEHDRMMVFVQAIRFFSNFSLGTFLAEEGFDIEQSLEFSSPLYRIEVNTINRLLAQDAALYVDILLASDERCAAIERLVKTCDRLANLLAQGNRAELIHEFETARQAFRDDAGQALRETNHVINHLSAFLAADQVEHHEHIGRQAYDSCPT